MRTPPPVLPEGEEDSPGYQRTWFDRAGPDAWVRLKTMGYGAMTGMLTFAALAMVPVPGGLAVRLVIAVCVGYMATFGAIKLSDTASAVAKSFTLPSGDSTPYEQTFSYQEAMIMQGDVDGALESFEAIIAEQPTLVAPRLRAAEHYVKANRNPRRAAELFRQVRDLPGVPLRDAVYSCSRLVDLYDGPLEEPGRAVVELRRIIELYPGSEMAKRARVALPDLKARLDTSSERRADS